MFKTDGLNYSPKASFSFHIIKWTQLPSSDLSSNLYTITGKGEQSDSMHLTEVMWAHVDTSRTALNKPAVNKAALSSAEVTIWLFT